MEESTDSILMIVEVFFAPRPWERKCSPHGLKDLLILVPGSSPAWTLWAVNILTYVLQATQILNRTVESL